MKRVSTSATVGAERPSSRYPEPCGSRAGFKRHLTKKHLAFLKQSVMVIRRRENPHQIDLLSPAKNRITDKEYRLAQWE